MVKKRNMLLVAWAIALLLALAGTLEWLSARWKLGINLSSSLPGSVYLVRKGVRPGEIRRGSIVVFRLRKDLAERFGFPEDILWAKRVVGIPGDRVRVAPDRTVDVGGHRVGYAKFRTSKGLPLEPAADGTVVPLGEFFVAGEHGDSLDSRYCSFGLVPFGDVVGAVVWQATTEIWRFPDPHSKELSATLRY